MKKKKIIKYIFRWLLIVIIIGVIASFGFIYYKGEEYAHLKIDEFIQKETQGKYVVNFSDIELDLMKPGISFSNLSVSPTSKNNDNFKLNLSTGQFRLKHIHLANFLKSEHLTIEKLVIEKPDIKIQQLTPTKENRDNYGELINQLIPFINKTFSSISINKIEIADAGLLRKVENKTKNTGIKFDIGIIGFYTDSVILSKANDFFEADDVFLRIENFKQTLSDSLHQITAEKLAYSIKNKGIAAQNIALTPSDSSKISKTKYWVNIPELQIQSQNIEQIFSTDTIILDTVYVKKARIKVSPPENSKSVSFKTIKEFDLYELVKEDFKQLKIQHLELQANNLIISRNYNQEKSNQNFKDIRVKLDDFQLDSSSYINPERILYSNDVQLSVGQYSIIFNDQVHQLSSENIFACSKTKSLNADHLKMMPVRSTSSVSTLVNMNCDSVRLNDIDLSRLFHKREMPLKQTAIFNPKISLTSSRDKESKRKEDSNSLLYHFIGNYIRGIYSSLVIIDNGSLNLKEYNQQADTGIVKTNFDFYLTDFSLDSVSANKTDKLFFATNFELNFSEYNMKLLDELHSLKIDNIDVSSLRKRATIKNLHLQPTEKGNAKELLKKYNRSELYEIKIPYLHLLNTNIHQAFFNKKLKINNFKIVDPSIYFELLTRNKKQKEEIDLHEFYRLLKNYISDISIRNIELTNGKFKLVNHSKKGNTISFDNKFNLTLNGFRLNDNEIQKKKLLFSDDFELIVNDYLFRLSDDVHYLQAKEIGFSSTKSEVFVRNAILYPDITNSRYKQLSRHLHTTVPEFKMHGVDLEQAYRTKQLKVKKLSLHEPYIKIYQTGKNRKKINLKDIEVPLPNSVQHLDIQKFEILKGKISVLNTSDFQDNEIAKLNIDLDAQEVELTNPGNKLPAKFNAHNFNSKLKNIEFTPPAGKYRFTLSELNYSKSKKIANLSNLTIKLTDQHETNGFRSANFPNLKIIGLNDENNKRPDCLNSTKILSSGARFHFKTAGARNTTPNFYNLKLNDDLLTIVNEISAKEIELKNASAYFENKNYLLENIQMQLSGFRINDKPSGKLFASENIDFVLNKFKHRDNKNWYNLISDKIEFSSKPSKLSIHDIQIKPRYSKNDFQKIIPFQTDYYKGKIKLVEIEKLDIEKLLENNEIHGNQIVLHGINLDIFRDMRTLFNEKQRPAMPQNIIRSIDVPFYFDSVLIKTSNISYAEQLENMPGLGSILFSNLNTSISPFSNINHILNKQPISTLSANALLMNKARLDVNMEFNLLSDNNEFTANGSIAPFQMKLLNPMTRNAAGIGIRSGQLNRFEFNFYANEQIAKGKLKFAYDDLKIDILDFKDGGAKESKFASFLANSLMVKSKNPRTKILLPDAIHFERDPKRSILNYWWKSIFSGAKNTFGIKENKNK